MSRRVPACFEVGRGFSLIELLVALVIFATMAAIAYAGLSAVTRTRTTLETRERELAALGRTLTFVERDLRGSAWRPVRDGEGRELPAVLGQAESLELSVHGRGHALGPDLGMVERVGYLRDAEGLHRLRWPVLDRVRTTVPDRRLVLPDVEHVRWRYLTADGRWYDQWPPPAGTLATAMPVAVEFTFTHATLGEIRRLVELPDPPRSPSAGAAP